MTISGVPSGASLSSGTDQGGGIWVIPASALAGLTITPPANFNGVFTLGLTVTSTETPLDGETDLTNNTATTTSSLVVTVGPVSDPPTLVVPASVAIKEDLGADPAALAPPAIGPAALAINVQAGAPGESAFVVISGIPAGVTFNAAGTVVPGGLRFSAAEAASL